MICYCQWCRPGWRKSKRDVRVQLVRFEDGDMMPLFLKRERLAS